MNMQNNEKKTTCTITINRYFHPPPHKKNTKVWNDFDMYKNPYL